MGVLDSDSLGGIHDEVTLTIGGVGTTRIAESYEVKQAIFTQPCGYAIRLGSSDTARKLLSYATPNTPTELHINGLLQQTGWIDGPDLTSSAQAGTTVTVHGRDALAFVTDPYIEADRSFGNLSLGELTDEVLGVCVPRTYALIYTNAANRKGLSGASSISVTAPDDIRAALTAPKAKQHTAKFGQKWWEFLKKEHDEAGVFLWADAAGDFILAQPNGSQSPIARIAREYGKTRNTVSVSNYSYRNSTVGRFSSYEVRSRGGGKSSAAIAAPNAPPDIKPALIGSGGSSGRKQHAGKFFDDEMVAWGFNRPWTHIHAHATDPKRCEFYARRECAKRRAESWNLTYTVAGHSTVSLDGGSRIVWAVDTIVEVVDEIIGVRGNFYVESVTFRRGPDGTSTELSLLRPADLVFGEV